MVYKDYLPGLYCITYIPTNIKYIGFSRSVVERLKKHFIMLRTSGHPNKMMQNYFNKYGEHNFEYSVLEATATHEELNDLEKHHIAKIGRANLFNMTDGGEGVSGLARSVEGRLKIKEGALRRAARERAAGIVRHTYVDRINVFTGRRIKCSSVTEPQRFGFHYNCIHNCLLGGKKTHRGFFWVLSGAAFDYDAAIAGLGSVSLKRIGKTKTFAMTVDAIDAADREPTDEDRATLQELAQIERLPVERIKQPYVRKPMSAEARRRTSLRFLGRVPINARAIERIDPVSGEIREYRGIRVAAKEGFPRTTIKRAILNGAIAHGFYWKFADAPT